VDILVHSFLLKVLTASSFVGHFTTFIWENINFSLSHLFMHVSNIKQFLMLLPILVFISERTFFTEQEYYFLKVFVIASLANASEEVSV